MLGVTAVAMIFACSLLMVILSAIAILLSADKNIL